MPNFYNKYPYTDFHELNLDWILETVKNVVNEWATTLTAWNETQQAWHDEQEAFQDLHDYVMNYFDNLDVQQEINNKLDQMAADGTLDAILLPYFNTYKNDINQIIATQNGRITILEDRMDTFASLPPGSTSGNAELLDIRVGADGITYPTAGDAVRGQFGVLSNITKPIINESAIATWSYGYYSLTSGAYNTNPGNYYYSSSALKFTYIPDQIRYDPAYLTYYQAGFSFISLWYQGTYVGYYNKGFFQPDGTSVVSLTFDTLYICMYSPNNEYQSFDLEGIYKTLYHATKSVTKDTLFDNFVKENFFNAHIGGYINQYGRIGGAGSAEWKYSELLYVEPGTVISYSLYGAPNVASVAFYEAADYNTYVSGVFFGTIGISTGSVTVPAGVHYAAVTDNIRFNSGGYAKYTGDVTLNQAIDVLHDLYESPYKSYWAGKKIGFLGDSITVGRYTPVGGSSPSDTATDPFPAVIADNTGALCSNYGVSGSSISSTTNTLPQQCFIARAPSMDNDLDMVVVLGGTNDYATHVPLGTAADRTDISFYGAMDVLCNILINKYPDKRIVFITPLLRDYNGGGEGLNPMGYNLEAIRKAIYDVAQNRYGLYVLDGKSVGLSPYNSTWRATYIYDGLHPNPIGHKLIGDNLTRMINAI